MSHSCGLFEPSPPLHDRDTSLSIDDHAPRAGVPFLCMPGGLENSNPRRDAMSPNRRVVNSEYGCGAEVSVLRSA